MYLRQVELQGFKSFAEKTTFEFHKGITCIVGPNGSGKSNISDAVRWVLGEQSARQLRGHNMQDVIFAGTQNRRPVSFASVSLLLDNADGMLPVDYQEVRVTRRIYRSGESEYLLNGTACRLRDIQELFYDTGVGKEGYSLIGQGQIEKILSGKPKDRRELFDEAAGIVKFKRRKSAALKKLEAQQENLIRVNDIITELERQVTPLKHQSEKAKTYLRKRDAMKEADVKLFFIQSSAFEEQKLRFEENIAQLQEELKEKREGYEKGREETDRIEEAQHRQEETIERLQSQVNEYTLLKSALEHQIELLSAQGRADELSREHYAGRLKDLEASLCEKEAQRTSNAQKLEELKKALGETKAQQEETAGALEVLNRSITAMQARIDEINAQILSLMEEKTQAEGRHRHYDTLLQETSQRRADLKAQELQAASLRDEKAKEAEKYDAAYREDAAQIGQLKKKLQETQTVLASLTDERNTLRDTLEEIRRSLAQASSKLETIRNMAERYEGYGQSIRKVMQKHHPGVIGVVADLMHTEKRYETAIETALGGSIQNIVTTDADAAREMIDYLKKERLGRATFLPLTDVTGRRASAQEERALQEKGVIGTADALVTCDARYRGIASSLLGGILVVDDADHAILIARKYRHSLRIVTLEGEYLRPGGSLTGGAFRNHSNLLGRRREQEALSETVTKLRSRQDDTASRLDEITLQRGNLRDEIARLQEEISQKEITANTALMDLKRLSDEEKNLCAQIEQTRAQIEEMDARLQESGTQHADSTQQIRRIEEERTALEDENAVLSQRYRAETREQKKRSEEAEKQALSIQSLNQNAGFLKTEMQRLSDETAQLQKEADAIRKTQSDALSRAASFSDRTGQIEAQIKEAQLKAQEADETLREARAEKEKLSASYRQFFEAREALTQDIARLEKEEYRLKEGLSRLEETMESRISFLWEEYGLTQREALQQGSICTESETALKKRTKELSAEIRSLGHVNVNAIEEYQEVGERYELMTAQRSDIEEAAGNLDKMIANLDSGMRKQFREQFARIQEEFQKVFSELFGGGHGSLELVQDEDDLETGIDVIAQPPGKKLQNMMQLSGGEKALTAISLLFAIQNLKPSAFCILDEIEAALDEPNVERFAQYLQKLSGRTQFIVITHRRGSMAAADRLYGITMQEKGVSVQVSVELAQEALDRQESEET